MGNSEKSNFPFIWRTIVTIIVVGLILVGFVGGGAPVGIGAIVGAVWLLKMVWEDYAE